MSASSSWLASKSENFKTGIMSPEIPEAFE